MIDHIGEILLTGLIILVLLTYPMYLSLTKAMKRKSQRRKLSGRLERGKDSEPSDRPLTQEIRERLEHVSGRRYWRYPSGQMRKRAYPPKRSPQTTIHDERQKRMYDVRTELERDPENGDLRYDLADLLIARKVPAAEKETLDYWQKFRGWNALRHGAKEAKENLNLALALGLSNAMTSAKARFHLLTILISEAPPSRRSVDANPRWKALVRDIIDDTKKYLRRHPHSLKALTIQKAAYEFLGNQSGTGRAEQALVQARSMAEAGLVATEEISLEQDKPRATTSKPGLDFEETTQKLLLAMGLKATSTKASADGGIDIVAFSESPIYSGKYIVQCKDWKKSVGEPIVRDLFGLVISEGANKGILVTSGRFTKAAERFAEEKQLELIDGQRLISLMRQYKVQQ